MVSRDEKSWVTIFHLALSWILFNFAKVILLMDESK